MQVLGRGGGVYVQVVLRVSHRDHRDQSPGGHTASLFPNSGCQPGTQSWVIEPGSIPTHLCPGKELAHSGCGQEGHPDPRTPPALHQYAKAETEYSNGQAAFNEEFHSPGLPGASPDSAALSMSLA